LERLQGYSHRSSVIITDLGYKTLFNEILFTTRPYKICLFLQRVKSHTVNARSDSTPSILTLGFIVTILMS
jgi:hypothetical protein